MPKKQNLPTGRLTASAIFALLIGFNSAAASDKGLGVLLSVTSLFQCAEKDMDKVRGSCIKPPTSEKLSVGLVTIEAVACKSPADSAGLKREDVVVSINGVKVSGLSQDAYEDLIEMATGGTTSWVILRKSFGHWEKKELTLLPAELGDDFSCGKPGSESRLSTGRTFG